MTVIDRGQGVPVIVVPGIQGRWEWHRPGIDALAARCRVLTFSLADEAGSGARFDPNSCIDSYCSQILDVMAHVGLTTASVCGISYGGLVAAVFAARHPERVSSLILTSALPPTWKPDARVERYVRSPRLLTPLFMVASLRLFGEMLSAAPHVCAAIATGLRHAWNALTHMFSPTRMARRAARLGGLTLTAEMAKITAPTLVIVGEPQLDRVVPVAATLEYTRLVPQARVATLERTGHLGCITRPDRFANLVVSFAEAALAGVESTPDPLSETRPTRRHLG
jgi:pimeloyl-ACP methyl ester carboxylesterase